MRERKKPSDIRASRRAVLGGALSAGAALAMKPRPLMAQEMQTLLPPGVAPKAKGPLVFRNYDQEELDYSYDQGPWAPNQQIVARRKTQNGEAARAHLGAPQRLAYGPTDIEKFDLYPARRVNAPTNIFIHGGAWRTSSAAAQAYLPETFVDAGANFIALDFTNVVETQGDLTAMANQIRGAIAWIYRNAAEFGANPDRLYVSGHSSGGHLAAVALTTDWQNAYGLPMDIVKGGLFACGMYDLGPVSLSARNTYVNFTEEVIEALSPQRHLDKLVAPIIAANGSLETPEFQRQGREFTAALQAAGKPVQYLLGEGYNHFEIIETLGNPYGLLGRAVLEQMNLTRS